MEFLWEWAGLVVACWCLILVEPSSCNLHEGTLVLLDFSKKFIFGLLLLGQDLGLRLEGIAG